ncbi:hypothetical protein NQZ68_016810 [Dissostichus eleginoides]|nr:hypothetical protein NQZ68_016810 [Dissostichus eleginoides]
MVATPLTLRLESAENNRGRYYPVQRGLVLLWDQFSRMTPSGLAGERSGVVFGWACIQDEYFQQEWLSLTLMTERKLYQSDPFNFNTCCSEQRGFAPASYCSASIPLPVFVGPTWEYHSIRPAALKTIVSGLFGVKTWILFDNSFYCNNKLNNIGSAHSDCSSVLQQPLN